MAATVRAPRAAAVAGIVLSVVLASVIGMFRSAMPSDALDGGHWLTSSAEWTRVEIALASLPLASIAVRWFRLQETPA